MKQIKYSWASFLMFALFTGALLRFLLVDNMEYKEDEQYNFLQSQLIGKSEPWPWVGIPSGVYLVNPGMSIWIFAALAKLFGIHHPTDLAHAVQGFSLLGICLILPFAYYFLETLEEKTTWLWAYALTMVNPFLILYHRKLWPEPFLPFFTMLLLMGWWKRSRVFGAFLFGLVGAVLGQIHMSGFFFALGLVLWTYWFDRMSFHQQEMTYRPVRWRYWFIGSTIGALPLIPWLYYIVQHPVGQSFTSGLEEITQLKYWVFWFTDALGVHLGNALGVTLGNSQWIQIQDFLRYPIVFGVPLYLVGLAHLIILLCGIFLFSKGLFQLWKLKLWKNFRRLTGLFIGQGSSTAFVQNSAFWACGILMTLTGVTLRRYYLCVTFPLEFILLIRFANPLTLEGKRMLATLWICELIISAGFVGYVHVNQGAPQGDYGVAYHIIKKDLPAKYRGESDNSDF